MPLPKHLLKQLPITALPRPGERIAVPPLAGAADALALAGIGSDGPMRVVMTGPPFRPWRPSRPRAGAR